jgi:hypothetical protein
LEDDSERVKSFGIFISDINVCYKFTLFRTPKYKILSNSGPVKWVAAAVPYAYVELESLIQHDHIEQFFL